MAIKETSSTQQQPPLLSLNHVSFVCKSVARSVEFYSDVLGFASIRRPSSFDFKGAWLFSHGIGIHLLEMDTTPMKKSVINPKDNHISFQCTNMDLIIKKLEAMGIKYVTSVVKEGGVEVNQLFFHDPDGYMIEICNCHVLPMLPISSPKINQRESLTHEQFCGEKEALMMEENLLIEMIGISF
ncbi:putative dihydroxybiphenyl dioxygenase [Tanacetum coccineum]